MGITNQADFTTPLQSLTNSNAEVIHRRPMISDISFYLDLTYRPLSQPVRTPLPGSSESSESTDINQEINTDFEENYLFEGGVV